MMKFLQPTWDWKSIVFRFPLAIFFSLVAAVLSVILNHGEVSTIYNNLEIGIFTSLIGILSGILVQVVYERFFSPSKKNSRWLMNLLAIVIIVIYYVFASRIPDFYSSKFFIRSTILIGLMMLSIIWLPSIQNEQLSFTDSFVIWFKSFFVSWVTIGVLTIGMLLVLAGWSMLISNVPGEYFMDILAISAFILFPGHLLSQQSPFTKPFEVQSGKMSAEINKFMDILLTKILLPLVTIYTLIIFIYLILSIDNWTDMTIEYIMVSYLIIGWMILFLVENIDRPMVNRFAKGYTIAVLMASLFQLYRSIVYTMTFGMTTDRYMLILFCAISVIAAVLYWRVIQWIPAVLAAGLLIAMLPPTDAITVSIASQEKVFEGVIEDYPDLIVDGSFQLTETNVSQLDDTSVNKIRQSLEYLAKYNAIDQLAFVPADFDEYTDLELLYRRDSSGNINEENTYYFNATLDQAESPSLAVEVNGDAEVVMLFADNSESFFTAFGKNYTSQLVDTTNLKISDEQGESIQFDLSSLEKLGARDYLTLTEDEATFEANSESYTGKLLVQNLDIWTSDTETTSRESSASFVLVLVEK